MDDLASIFHFLALKLIHCSVLDFFSPPRGHPKWTLTHLGPILSFLSGSPFRLKRNLLGLRLNNKLQFMQIEYFSTLPKRKFSINDLDIGTCPNCLSFKGKIRLFWPFCCWQSHLLGPIWRDLHSATYVASAKSAEYRPYLYFKSK